MVAYRGIDRVRSRVGAGGVLVHRLMSAIVLAMAATGCTDAFAPAPNTDVGLYVWAEVTPATLSIRDSTTEIHVRIYVRNPSGSEIRVVSGGPPYTFTTDPARSRGLWGSFRVACAEAPLNCGPNTDFFGDSVYVFPPHQTDFSGAKFTLKSWANGGWPIAVRAYHIRGWFNGREGASATLNITQ